LEIFRSLTVKCRNAAAKLVPINSAIISPGPLFGSVVGVGVGVVAVGLFLFVEDEEELGGAAGVVAGALLVGAGEGVGVGEAVGGDVAVFWLGFGVDIVVGAGLELLETLW
jgi:hypothetical protein